MSRSANRDSAAIVLAGGMGKRLGGSDELKPAQTIAGKPLVRWVIEACLGVVNGPVVVVVPPLEHGGDLVIERAGVDVVSVVQETPLGTGHAFLAARPVLERFQGDLIVTVGDAPALQSEDLEALLEEHRKQNAAVTLTTAEFDPVPPYGRVVRDAEGKIVALIEESDASSVQRQIREVTTSQWVFSSPIVWPLAMQFQRSQRAREMYLTDIVTLAGKAGLRVAGWRSKHPEHHLGVNTSEEFEVMKRYLERRQATKKWDAIDEVADARNES
ncbi:MAG: NTP transferase domain-containing protein [bacterium]